MAQRKVLLLNGSPRRGNSLALASHLSDLLTQKGLECHTLDIGKMPLDDLFTAMGEADVVILSFPLYVDSLPGSLTRILEQIHTGFNGEGRAFAAIVNCGFPESDQAATAVDITRNFARSTGFRWLGGLSMGAGGAIGDRSVAECGGMLRNVVAGLNLAADDIYQERDISAEAVRLVGLPLFPHLLYRVMAGQHFRRQAKKNGAKIYDRPYEWKRRR
jgi:multimeric flavodoxin WrbA